MMNQFFASLRLYVSHLEGFIIRLDLNVLLAKDFVQHRDRLEPLLSGHPYKAPSNQSTNVGFIGFIVFTSIERPTPQSGHYPVPRWRPFLIGVDLY